jgi:hypothetical protein
MSVSPSVSLRLRPHVIMGAWAGPAPYCRLTPPTGKPPATAPFHAWHAFMCSITHAPIKTTPQAACPSLLFFLNSGKHSHTAYHVLLPQLIDTGLPHPFSYSARRSRRSPGASRSPTPTYFPSAPTGGTSPPVFPTTEAASAHLAVAGCIWWVPVGFTLLGASPTPHWSSARTCALAPSMAALFRLLGQAKPQRPWAKCWPSIALRFFFFQISYFRFKNSSKSNKLSKFVANSFFVQNSWN